MEEILQALEKATAKVDLSIQHITSLASTVVKEREEGLLAAARHLGVGIDFYENTVLAAQIDKYHLEESPFVKDTIGIGNVAEAAVYASVTSGRLVLQKTKYNRVTVALLWEHKRKREIWQN